MFCPYFLVIADSVLRSYYYNKKNETGILLVDRSESDRVYCENIIMVWSQQVVKCYGN